MRTATLYCSQSLVCEDFNPSLSRKLQKKIKPAPVHVQLRKQPTSLISCAYTHEFLQEFLGLPSELGAESASNPR